MQGLPRGARKEHSERADAVCDKRADGSRPARRWCRALIASASQARHARASMSPSERLKESQAKSVEALTARSPSGDLMETVRGFRVEWDDGVVGIAGGMAIFVRTAGYGTGHDKLELLTTEDVEAIFPAERRILARTRLSSVDALRKAAAGALRRRGVYVFSRRSARSRRTSRRSIRSS